MKWVLAGGSGHIGQLMRNFLTDRGHEVIVLSRAPSQVWERFWDAKTVSDWQKELESSDVVLNLAGRSVNCRYKLKNLQDMMDSRVDSTRVLGQAIAECTSPPKVWLQSSTATIYAHRYDAPNDEYTGLIGEGEADVRWRGSIEIAKAWEAEFEKANTPQTRKVALRSSMVMQPESGSIFDELCKLARRGLLGTPGDGRQYVSWIHGEDFCRALLFLCEHEELEGAVNVCSPNPMPSREFYRTLREALGVHFGFPAPKIALEIGAALMKTETELVLKSRRVVPARLLESGFEFRFPDWIEASEDLAKKMRGAH